MRLKSILISLLLIITAKAFSQNDVVVDSLPRLPVIHFGKTVFLDAKSKLTLDTVLKVVSNYPAFKLFVIGGSSSACEFCQQVSWDRVYSVVKYLTKKGFDSTRIIFDYGESKEDFRAIELTLTKDDGPPMVPAPHPCHSYHQPKKKRCINVPGHENGKL